MIVGVNGHFKIEASVFRQVTVSIGVLSTEDGANLENPTEVGRNSLLLGELRTLGEESTATEVVYGEDCSTTFSGGRLKLRGVDLNEAVLFEGVSEDAGDHGTHTEKRLVGRVSEIEDSGVHAVAQGLWGLVVAKGEVLSGVDEVNRHDVNLNIGVCSRSNRLGGALEDTSDLDKRFGVDLSYPCDKVGITGITGENTLNGVCLVAEEEEVENL
jgi:hypothetical protein